MNCTNIYCKYNLGEIGNGCNRQGYANDVSECDTLKSWNKANRFDLLVRDVSLAEDLYKIIIESFTKSKDATERFCLDKAGFYVNLAIDELKEAKNWSK